MSLMRDLGLMRWKMMILWVIDTVLLGRGSFFLSLSKGVYEVMDLVLAVSTTRWEHGVEHG